MHVPSHVPSYEIGYDLLRQPGWYADIIGCVSSDMKFGWDPNQWVCMRKWLMASLWNSKWGSGSLVPFDSLLHLIKFRESPTGSDDHIVQSAGNKHAHSQWLVPLSQSTGLNCSPEVWHDRTHKNFMTYCLVKILFLPHRAHVFHLLMPTVQWSMVNYTVTNFQTQKIQDVSYISLQYCKPVGKFGIHTF